MGHNIIGDAANEPWLVENPINPNNMLIGWRQFDSITSNEDSGRGYEERASRVLDAFHLLLPAHRVPGDRLFRRDACRFKRLRPGFHT